MANGALIDSMSYRQPTRIKHRTHAIKSLSLYNWIATSIFISEFLRHRCTVSVSGSVTKQQPNWMKSLYFPFCMLECCTSLYCPIDYFTIRVRLRTRHIESIEHFGLARDDVVLCRTRADWLCTKQRWDINYQFEYTNRLAILYSIV